MFTVAVPVFVTVTVCVALPPTATLPNVTLVDPAESTPLPGFDGEVFAELVYPAQFDRPIIATNSTIVTRREWRLEEMLLEISCREIWDSNCRVWTCVLFFMTRAV